MTGQSQPVSTVYSTELDGQSQYQAPSAVSPPPQHSPSSAETRPNSPANLSPTPRETARYESSTTESSIWDLSPACNPNPGPAIRPMAAMAAQNPPAEREKLGVPSRNPLPLSASQEAQVRDIYYQRVRSQCAEEIKAFAACALGRTFTVSFVCRPEHRVMNNCMKLHATQDEHDAARVEWFSMRLERRRERERKNKMAAAQEEFMREWWGLPEHVRLSRQKEMEKRGERIPIQPPAEGEKR
ncbi:hypothetical protein G7Z17_g12859 [Cylindrodendrum hubeiense]|uniref:COX assembly mitochondrial protein n=1 Tax=Cylindrodendrum hubeiense TaxID=595255 RepID=A0A9P5GY33_9HYPO|nr:hypothetical protein G7Z17_g12859 [Cylindrodendrum hubeiense]